MELTPIENEVLTYFSAECRRLPNQWFRPDAAKMKQPIEQNALEAVVKKLVSEGFLDSLPVLDMMAVKINPKGETFLTESVKKSTESIQIQNPTFNMNAPGQINMGSHNTQNVQITLGDVLTKVREQVEGEASTQSPEKKSALSAIDTVLRHPLLDS